MNLRIGVFDSGIGGITVLSELKNRFPAADYFYLGDSANLPYGTKSPSQIKKLSIACAQIFKAKKVDLLVVACNTVSSWAIQEIQEVMGDTPVYEVVNPGADSALNALTTLEAQTSIPPSSLTPIPVL